MPLEQNGMSGPQIATLAGKGVSGKILNPQQSYKGRWSVMSDKNGLIGASWDSLGTDIQKKKCTWHNKFDFVKLGNNMPILFK